MSLRPSWTNYGDAWPTRDNHGNFAGHHSESLTAAGTLHRQAPDGTNMVLRFLAEDVGKDLDGVLDSILQSLVGRARSGC